LEKNHIFNSAGGFHLYLFFFFLMIIAFSFGSLLFGVFLQLRRTYSRNAMQIIEIRNKIYGMRPEFFNYKRILEDNTSNVRASKLGLHLIFTILISIINSIILSTAFSLLLTQPKWLPFIVFVIAFACHLIIALCYLKRDRSLAN
jgi:hypothetical protein